MKTITMLSLMLATPAVADVSVQFIEGAPKDKFVISNTSECALLNAEIEINFTDSLGKLIFDVTGNGAGVEVFQPLEITEGLNVLDTVPVVEDGDQVITFNVSDLPAKEKFAFTIDVDDTVASREITVSNSEMSGAAVKVTNAKGTKMAVFEKQPKVNVTSTTC